MDCNDTTINDGDAMNDGASKNDSHHHDSHDDHVDVVVSTSYMEMLLHGLTNLKETIVEFISTNKTLNNDEDVQRIITTMNNDGSKKSRRMKIGAQYNDDGSSSSSIKNNNDGVGIGDGDGDDQYTVGDAYGDAYGDDIYDDDGNANNNHHNNNHNNNDIKDSHQQQQQQQYLQLHLQATVEDVTMLVNKVILCYHTETMLPKINFMEFRAGDIALFMPAGIYHIYLSMLIIITITIIIIIIINHHHLCRYR